MNRDDLAAILKNLETREKLDFYDAGLACDRIAEEIEYVKKSVRAIIEVLVQVAP